MRTSYYPGCSLEGGSEAYDMSVRAVCEVLGVHLAEVDDWNCCGATEISALNQVGAYALIARNLARVAPEDDQLVAPCAACYLNLKKADKVMQKHPKIGAKVARALAAGGLSYDPGNLKIRHLLEFFYEEIGEAGFKKHLKTPLTGLRIAPYYGCQIVRPDDGIEDPEYPTMLDEMLRWMGATVVDYPLKTHCCGGHLSQLSEDMSNELIRRLLHNADQWHGDLIATLCPMCQLNLDAYQSRVNSAFDTDYDMPVLYFTQLIGLAFGLDAKLLGFGKEIVDASRVLLKRLSVEAPAAPKKKRPKKPRRDPSALPMPVVKGARHD